MRIDLDKPLEIYNSLTKLTCPCYLLGIKKDSTIVVETKYKGQLHCFDVKTLSSSTLQLRNVLEEPWQEAFNNWEIVNNVAKAFEAGFEAGINYALGTVK